MRAGGQLRKRIAFAGGRPTPIRQPLLGTKTGADRGWMHNSGESLEQPPRRQQPPPWLAPELSPLLLQRLGALGSQVEQQKAEMQQTTSAATLGALESAVEQQEEA